MIWTCHHKKFVANCDNVKLARNQIFCIIIAFFDCKSESSLTSSNKMLDLSKVAIFWFRNS